MRIKSTALDKKDDNRKDEARKRDNGIVEN
jgi:hypothetical protein